MTVHEEAKAALDAKQFAERDLARAMDCPPWRHAAFGLVMGGLVATPAIPLPWRFVALAAILAGIFLIAAADRRRRGLFVNGYRRGKTLFVSLALLVIILALFALSARGALAGNHAAPLLLGLAAFIVSVIGSIMWQRIFVAELGA